MNINEKLFENIKRILEEGINESTEKMETYKFNENLSGFHEGIALANKHALNLLNIL
jgi:hypothetical protein